MALQQSLNIEMFAGQDPSPFYTDEGQFGVKFTACWSRSTDEKLWFACVVWGNKTTSDKPSAKELGWLASYVLENLKNGDRILVRGRIQGTKTGTARLWADDTKKEMHAAYLDLVVQELSITEAKANRPAKAVSNPMPPVEEMGDDHPIPVDLSRQPAMASVSAATPAMASAPTPPAATKAVSAFAKYAASKK